MKTRKIALLLCFFTLLYCKNETPIHQSIYIDEIQKIDEIFIIYRSGEAIHFKKNIKDSWLINSKYEAREDALTNLLNTLQQQRIKSIPTKAVAELMIKDIAVFGTKIELYSGGHNVKTLYVGGVTSDELGTHIMVEGVDQPYIAYLPGFQGSLRSRYVMTLDDWRARRIVPFALDTLMSLQVRYNNKQQEDFELHNKNGQWQIKSGSRYSPSENTPNESLIRSYLTELFSAGIESFDNQNPERNEWVSRSPFCEMTFKFILGSEFGLRFISPPARDNFTGQIYIFTSADDFCLAQDRVLNKVFVGYDYFFR